MSRSARLLAVLVLAAGACAAADASPLAVRDGDYTGAVVGGQGDASGAFQNDVSLTVFSGGTGLRGVITYIVDTSVEGTKLCLRFVADFTTAPLAINDTGASGSVAIEHAAADGACDSSSVFEGSQVDSADFSIAFNGTSAIGTLTIPGDPPIALQFKADRAGSNPSTTSNEPIAGIGEFVDGVALTEETRKRIEELEACTDEDLQVGGRCDNESALTPFKALAELRFGQGALADDVELQRAAVLATLRDPSGKLLCPSIGPMFPVLMALRARSVIDESANIALNRLVGLLVAMDLDARK